MGDRYGHPVVRLLEIHSLPTCNPLVQRLDEVLQQFGSISGHRDQTNRSARHLLLGFSNRARARHETAVHTSLQRLVDRRGLVLDADDQIQLAHLRVHLLQRPQHHVEIDRNARAELLDHLVQLHLEIVGGYIRVKRELAHLHAKLRRHQDFLRLRLGRTGQLVRRHPL